MGTVLLVIGVVSGALVVGAAWGLSGRLPTWLEAVLVALAGGALIVSTVTELVEPSAEDAGLTIVLAMVMFGAVTFVGLDHLVDEVWQDSGGAGLLLSIVLDGIPENLALGTALIGADPSAVAALSGSILLSNLPEAAGGAKRMVADGHGRGAVLAAWAVTAGVLSIAALLGWLLLDDAAPATLAAVRSFAAGAVVASLATEVFPQAYQEDHDLVGIAAAVGVVIAFALSQLG